MLFFLTFKLRMRAVFYILVSGILLSLGACSKPDKYKAQITALDSLRLELDKKLAVFNSIDTLKIKRYVDKYYANIKWMKENIKDTLSARYLTALNKYQTINDPLLFLKTNFSLMQKDAAFNKQQLQKLSLDLSKNLIEDEKAFEYYAVEKLEAEKMTEVLQSNYILAKQSLDSFEKYNNEIEKLIATYQLDAKK